MSTDKTTNTTPQVDDVLSQRLRLCDPNGIAETYENLSVIKRLSKGKCPIYLVSSKLNNQNYAMKVFCHIDKNNRVFYKNEKRFASLHHSNIIDMVHCEDEKEVVLRGKLEKASCILMEYAPYGDFSNLINNYHAKLDEKLIRTYFRQLVDGIEYLHRNNVAHLDLKPENLLIGADFNLKIADFDLSHIYGDKKIISRGTRYYRAPEFFKTGSSSSSSFELEDPFTADIYSAATILFVLKSDGMYPHAESQSLKGLSFVDLMYNNNTEFWAQHCEIQEKGDSFYTDDFKDLFNNMVKLNPKERMTIGQIKGSAWYNGPVYTPLELKEKMKEIYGC